jgi:hypothetical protein
MSRDIRTMPLYQSDASYNRSLTELKNRVKEGVHLHAYDDNTRGSKNTECTLGLCDDSIEEAQDGVYSREHHHCPHDARYFTKAGEPTGTKPDLNGCFHTCRVFKRKLSGGSVIERIKAIQLIDEVMPASSPGDQT